MAKTSKTGEPKTRRVTRRVTAPKEEKATDMAASVPTAANDAASIAPGVPSAEWQRAAGLNARSAKDRNNRPDPQDVARRAYEIYRARGGGHGHDREDWLQAERELRQRSDRH